MNRVNALLADASSRTPLETPIADMRRAFSIYEEFAANETKAFQQQKRSGKDVIQNIFKYLRSFAIEFQGWHVSVTNEY